MLQWLTTSSATHAVPKNRIYEVAWLIFFVSIPYAVALNRSSMPQWLSSSSASTCCPKKKNRMLWAAKAHIFVSTSTLLHQTEVSLLQRPTTSSALPCCHNKSKSRYCKGLQLRQHLHAAPKTEVSHKAHNFVSIFMLRQNRRLLVAKLIPFFVSTSVLLH